MLKFSIIENREIVFGEIGDGPILVANDDIHFYETCVNAKNIILRCILRGRRMFCGKDSQRQEK